jgi:hypothetical protein
VLALLLLADPAWAQKAEQRNMRLVGQDDLQARSAYQPVIQRQGDRWIAYVGHHGGRRLNPLTGQVELNGTSIVDVTDPRSPRYVNHIPGAPGEAEAGGAAMARVCEGKTLPKGDPAKTYLLRTLGNLSHEVWDVSVPEKPMFLTTVVKGLDHTHKNWWECDTGIAYLVSDGRPEGWRIVAAHVSLLGEATVMRPVGCDRCRQTGYKGRMGIFEIFEIAGVDHVASRCRGCHHDGVDHCGIPDGGHRLAGKPLLS